MPVTSHWTGAVVGPSGIPTPQPLALNDICNDAFVADKLVPRLLASVPRIASPSNSGRRSKRLDPNEMKRLKDHADNCRPCRQRLGWPDF